MSERWPVVAIDIGGTKIAGGVVLPGGGVRLARQVPTEAWAGGESVLARAIALAQELRHAALTTPTAGLATQPAAVGIGAAGGVDPESGRIVFATSALPGWQGIALRDRMASALDLPTFADNDGNVMALGEAAHGAGRGYQHVVGLTVGTGVGGGIVLEGRVFHGAWGGAGRIGHLIVAAEGPRPCYCGGQGCLEAYASAPAMLEDFLATVGHGQAGQELGPDIARMDVRELARLAAAGHEAAAAVIDRGARYLGAGIATLLNLLNPAVVVLGGGVVQIGDVYLDAVRQAAAAHALPTVRETPILPAQLGTAANLVGAAVLAWQGLE
jgi:glucokinase